MKQILWVAFFLMVLARDAPAQIAKFGTITATAATCTSTACVFLNITPAVGGAGVTISGTWSATLMFEGSADGQNFSVLTATPIGSSTSVTSTAANGSWQIATAGLQVIRVRCSAYTSGTANVQINGSTAFYILGGGGGGGGGTVT